MELKNKIIAIMCIFIILTFFIFSSVFAVDIIVDDITYSLPDFPDDGNSYVLLFYYGSSNSLDLYTSSHEFKYDPNSGRLYFEGFKRYMAYLRPDTATTTIFQLLQSNDSSSSVYSKDYVDSLIYSNFDVYNNTGDLVFPAAPLEAVEPMKIQQVEKIPQEAIKIVKMIIPVCLTIFGILLVLYLIKSKNLLQL